MRKVLSSLILGVSLFVITQTPSQANNCNPASYYKIPGQGITRLDRILTGNIVGNSNCRVYLYGFNNSGDLVKLNSYGLVGDRVELYSAVWGYGDDMYYQVYFPSSNFWAWIPEMYVWIND